MTNIQDPNDTSLPSPEALRRALAEQDKPRKRVKKGAEKPAAEPTPEMLLTRCAVSLSEQARRGELRQAYGRDESIDAIWQLLRPDSSRNRL
jgi:ATP-dependent Clp protease ATP-binding subunit ClpA